MLVLWIHDTKPFNWSEARFLSIFLSIFRNFQNSNLCTSLKKCLTRSSSVKSSSAKNCWILLRSWSRDAPNWTVIQFVVRYTLKLMTFNNNCYLFWVLFPDNLEYELKLAEAVMSSRLPADQQKHDANTNQLEETTLTWPASTLTIFIDTWYKSECLLVIIYCPYNQIII